MGKEEVDRSPGMSICWLPRTTLRPPPRQHYRPRKGRRSQNLLGSVHVEGAVTTAVRGITPTTSGPSKHVTVLFVRPGLSLLRASSGRLARASPPWVEWRHSTSGYDALVFFMAQSCKELS